MLTASFFLTSIVYTYTHTYAYIDAYMHTCMYKCINTTHWVFLCISVQGWLPCIGWAIRGLIPPPHTHTKEADSPLCRYFFPIVLWFGGWEWGTWVTPPPFCFACRCSDNVYVAISLRDLHGRHHGILTLKIVLPPPLQGFLNPWCRSWDVDTGIGAGNPPTPLCPVVVSVVFFVGLKEKVVWE